MNRFSLFGIILLRVARAFIMLSVALSATGCGRAASSDAPIAPRGVVLPARMTPGTDYRGLYVERQGSTGCCWLARRAVISLVKPTGAHKLFLVFYLPTAGPAGETPISLWLQKHPLDLNGRFSSSQYVERRCCYGPGLHDAIFDLPRSISGKRGIIELTLWTEKNFTPVEIDPQTPDQRQLSVFLVRTYWR